MHGTSAVVRALSGVVRSLVVIPTPNNTEGVASAIYNTSPTTVCAVIALVMPSLVSVFGCGEDSVATTSHGRFAVVWALCAAIGMTVNLHWLRITGKSATDNNQF